VATPESKNSIQVIERMTRLLDALAGQPETVALKQLAQATGLHPSTAHRILTALVHERLVERIDQGNYRLGIRLLELGNLVKARISVREHALPFMRELHAVTGEAVNLSVRHNDEIIYIERTSSGRSMMRVVNIVGARAPLHITAVGKLFLMEDGPDSLHIYARRTGLPAYTKNTLTSIAALEKEFDRATRQGYALDNEEAELGVRCIGAAVRDDTGALVAGLSVSAPAERMKTSWAGMVRNTAEKISRSIGYRG
jgi:DNA-binding IclR family transcriptional regulator